MQIRLFEFSGPREHRNLSGTWFCTEPANYKKCPLAVRPSSLKIKNEGDAKKSAQEELVQMLDIVPNPS